ncbi:hypothetical protein ACF1DV_25995 [Streptomyces achromogenes]|uniref:hypothetical protein n=1 Tax=Streptomyces achromogenes TaxID=67255 RepID=UPI0036F9F696
MKTRIEFTAFLDVEGITNMNPVDAVVWVRKALLCGDKHADGWALHSSDLRTIEVVGDDE